MACTKKMKGATAVLFFMCTFFKLVHNRQLYKICVEDAARDPCQQISRNQEFACTENIVSKVDCFINIDQNEPQFTVVNGEQALLAAPLVSDNVVVIGEIKSVYAPIQSVVLIRKPYDGGFENLKEKRFCHPGFRHDELATKLILEEFESKVLDTTNYCASDNITVLEKKIKGLSHFFGSSCRPGAWTESDELDTKLKTQYPSLCELCGVEKCNLVYQVPFNDTLLCLTQKGGDIAVTTLIDAITFFGNPDNVNNYQYLCPNGSVSEANTPCTWTNQLNRLIITGNSFAGTAKTYLQENLAVHMSGLTTTSTLTLSLQSVLALNKDDTITLIDPKPLRTFVTEKRTIPRNDTSPCSQTIRWCTLNDLEQQKCLWLQRAAINIGLIPFIECRQAEYNEQLTCLSDIEAGTADIAFIDVNYGYTAIKKGLTVVAYTETDKRQLSSILIVVEQNTTSINSLNDLKGKRACFPEYAGKEWLAFIDVLRSKKVLPDSCDYGKVFSEFVGQSCVPGARDHNYGIDSTDESKLCSQCVPVKIDVTASYCNADSVNKYYGGDGALKCLIDNNADYAVITLNDISSLYLDSSQFRVLSQNGSLSQLPTLRVDDKASLIILTAGGVVARNDSPKKEDIILFLRDIEKEFGQNLLKNFKVFEKFNNTKDLLFPDSTPGLTFGGTVIEYVENFKTLLYNSQKCLNTNDGAINVPSILLMVVFTYLVIRF